MKQARVAALATGIIPRFEGKGFAPPYPLGKFWTKALGMEKFATDPKATPSTRTEEFSLRGSPLLAHLAWLLAHSSLSDA